MELICLIDSGSTHNFINERIAGILKLPVEPTSPFNVKVANGDPLQCNGKFRNTPALLQGIPFTITFYSLPIIGLDVVLGVQWLRKLGTVQCNWDKLTMDFLWKGEQHHLQGIKGQPIKASPLKTMAKDLKHNNSLFAICVETTSTVFPEGIHPEMKLLLDQFPDIYQKPSQLPPEREINHRINLKEGTNPINVRPYRYAHFQKAEIEKQIRATISSHPYMIKLGSLASENPGAPYSWRNGLILYKNRVVVPPKSDLTLKIMQEFHDSPSGGHSGILRTYKRVAPQFYWPSMRKQIQEYIAACTVCQKNKTVTSSPAGLLQPLPIPHQVWDDIAMDFIDGLPTSHGKNSILVVTDRSQSKPKK
ncbi:hypothetical protein GH714_034621 [Hevea brasiliensis]|uniref:Integrase zinc-binding domain-containing protein n=1 Tax=Hevea brasiliensis TaxID=3981 RepID=A0A6A6KYD9_HEVBR|nr:hypothetical protein GH714_034621 [Hevea brasiliensis]